MIPIRDNQLNRNPPLVTWTLILLNVAIYLWDRQGQIFGQSVVFADLAMRPREIVEAIPGVGDRFALVTVFTSMFLHANLVHLLGNMVFLLAFGNSVENTIGPFRYAVYYLFWGFAAGAAHIFVEPGSIIPTVGASGAIGGVLGCYFLLFPGNKIEFIIPVLPFWPFVVSAWIMLGMWFLWQILIPQQGVANWAHAGGFLAGMVTVLIMGGRQRVLSENKPVVDYDFN